jgi:hypothetical protein
MIVCIDESGDSGFKFSKGSSQYFTCVAVFFSDSFAADSCDRAIDQIKREMGLGTSHEFHFKYANDQTREIFLTKMASENFTYYGFVLNKPSLFGRTFNDKHGFYDFTVGLICENARPIMRNAKVIIDKCGDRQFKLNLEKSLKNRMTEPDGTCLIKKVTMEGSHTNNLVQLADMICGAVARSFNTDRDHRDRFHRLIKKREGRVQFWPK